MINAVWLVRSHQIAADLRYWLTFIGYDKRDHSLAHKVYLVYATLFFTVWAFATLSLLASWAGAGLRALSGGPALEGVTVAAAGLLALALLVWWLVVSFKAGRASPLTFTEDDAALICQAPVSRPAVALLWMLGDWIKTGPVFWALSVTLAFALQDQALGAAVSVEYVPRYILAGLRALALVVPLQWGLMAVAYAWGVLRLQRDRERRAWWAGPLILAALLVGLLVGSLQSVSIAGSGGLFVQLAKVPALLPLTLPAELAYRTGDWNLGLLIALLWAGLGSLALGMAARPLNLGRAAQESTGRAAAQSAALVGNQGAAAEISLRRKLGTGHTPTRLAVRSGWGALAWQNAVAWERRGPFSFIGMGFVIFAAGLGAVLAPDWGPRAWSMLAWLIAVQQFAAGPLMDDLRLWPVLRGLPVNGRQTLLGSLLLPLVLAALLTWLALLVGTLVGDGLYRGDGALPGWAALVVPGGVAVCGLAAALDVLRSCRSSRLLTGQVPMPGTTGVLIAGVISALAVLAVQFMYGGAPGFLFGGLLLAGAAYLLLDYSSGRLSEIE